MEYNFEKLLVWQKAMQLVQEVYTLSKQFPADERFALTDQLRRAAVSIPSNIAEGAGRSTNKDYAHFLAMARGSLYETLTQVRIARDLGYCVHQSSIDSLADEIVRMLGAMLKKYGSIHSSTSHFNSENKNYHCSTSTPHFDSPTPHFDSPTPHFDSQKTEPHHCSTSTPNFDSPTPTSTPNFDSPTPHFD